MSIKCFKKIMNVGFTCGSFDMLHAGHAMMLEECKSYCDYLIVGLQSDPSIDRNYKNKPIQSLEERMTMLSSIKWVDEIITYTTEKDLYNIIEDLVASGIVNTRIIGEDWKDKKYTGHDIKVNVIFNTRSHSYSTSDLRRRVYVAESIKRKEE